MVKRFQVVQVFLHKRRGKRHERKECPVMAASAYPKGDAVGKTEVALQFDVVVFPESRKTS